MSRRKRTAHHEETQAPPEAHETEALLMTEDEPKKAEPRRWNDDNRFKSIRGHIAELIQSGDEARAHLLRKVLMRLDRIEGKSA